MTFLEVSKELSNLLIHKFFSYASRCPNTVVLQMANYNAMFFSCKRCFKHRLAHQMPIRSSVIAFNCNFKFLQANEWEAPAINSSLNSAIKAAWEVHLITPCPSSFKKIGRNNEDMKKEDFHGPWNTPFVTSSELIFYSIWYIFQRTPPFFFQVNVKDMGSINFKVLYKWYRF